MLSDSIGEWIEQAQAEGKLQTTYTRTGNFIYLICQACDPCTGVLRSSHHDDDDYRYRNPHVFWRIN